MTRSNRVFKKRKPPPNGYFQKKKSPALPAREANVCSSSTSIRMAYDNFDTQDILDIVNLRDLMNFLGKFVACRACGGEVYIEYGNRQGLQLCMSLKCSSCSSSQIYSNSEKNTNSDVYDINLRLIYALRIVGQGEAGAKSFCAAMNLHDPPDCFESGEKVLSNVIEEVARDSMKRAMNESTWLNENSRELSVVFDGSSQKRGVSSAGIVSASSLDSGKVIDVAIFPNVCSCEGRVAGKHKVSCECKDYFGNSGEMEVAGVKQIIENSKQYDVKYTEYLGDGSSSAFDTLRESKPYGPDQSIEKLECIGYYVYKRMGSRLRDVRNRAPLMEDGKHISGQGRLTNTVIKQIQMYCGLAIGRNIHSLEEMRKAVWAVYFHLISTDSDPCHGLCPNGDDSWCKYQKAAKSKLPYKHSIPYHLPAVVMRHLKPIFTDLSNPQLLRKCLRGKAQNMSEGLNHEIWSRIPKRVNVGSDCLKLAVFDAIASHNEGNIVRCRVFQKMGVNPGMGCVSGMKKMDLQRLEEAEEEASKITREAKQERMSMEEQ